MNRNFAILAFLFCGYIFIFDVRAFDFVEERFIGHADQANVGLVARNLVEGHGFQTDARWILYDGGLPGNSVRHPEGYWSIYAAALLSPFFLLFGSYFFSAALAASLFKLGSAGLVFFLIQKLTSKKEIAVVGFMLFMMEPSTIHLTRNPLLTDGYFVFFLLLTGALLLKLVTSGKWQYFLLTGMTIGIAIGLKKTGYFLLLYPAVLVVVRTFKAKQLSLLALCYVGVALASLLTIWHNMSSFGSLFSPGVAKVTGGALAKFVSNNHPDYSYYTPVATMTGEFSDHIRRSFINMQLNARALTNNRMFSLWLLLPAVFGYFKLTADCFVKKREQLESGMKTAILIFVTLSIVMAGILFFLVHFEVRYFAFLSPILIVLACYKIADLSKIQLGAVVAIGASFYMLYVLNDWNRDDLEPPPHYKVIEEVVPVDSVIMAHSPWEIAFHTRRKGVVTPTTSKLDEIKDVARRFDVEYLVLELGKGFRHDIYRWIKDNPQQLATDVYKNKDVMILKLRLE